MQHSRSSSSFHPQKTPQTKEVRQLENEKEDMFRILIEQSGQIKAMEVEMEKLLKEREQSTQLAAIPLTAVPITSTSTARPSTSATITVEGQSTDSSEELIRAMDDLSIRGQEIEKLKTQWNNLREKKLKIDNVYLAELQKTHKLTQKIEQLQNESIMAQTLAQAKEHIWVEINEAMTEIWPSNSDYFLARGVNTGSKEAIKEVKADLGQS